MIESSLLLNGATTTMMLADLGAQVIKVESPSIGDYIRVDETRYLHQQVNKGKRSIALDLRKADGYAVFLRLLADADVFVTNAVGDRNRKLGLSYDQLREHKPDIVYCQNTGYGATGPYATLPTHGQMMDALAGARPVVLGDDGLTHPKGPFGWPALRIGGEATATGAVYAAFHIAAALAHRERAGAGCYIDVAAACAVVANAWSGAAAQLNDPELVRRLEDERAAQGVARYQWYETRDHKFVLFCPEEKRFWEVFCDLVARPDLKDRVHGLDLRCEIQAILHTKDRDEWMRLALEHGLPLGPVHDGAREVQADPQIAARNIFLQAPGPGGGTFIAIGQPALVDGRGTEVSDPAPELGEHTDQILRELGYDDAAIAQLAANEVTRSARFADDYLTLNVHGQDSVESP